jgi:photosystem II stability/assembly factor-like uncharacterized protein
MKEIAALLMFCGVLGRALAGGSEPSRPYEWRNVAIGGGGFVTGLIAHPLAKDLMYARTDVGGAYRWSAATGHWIPITDSLGDADFTGIESLALDPSDPGRVYLAAGIYQWNKAAIFRSADQGRTWRYTLVPFKMGGNETGRFNGERLAVDPHDGKVLFFGSRRDGLWRSPDGGATWNPVPGFPALPPENPAPIGRRRSGDRAVGIVCVLFDDRSVYAAVSTLGTNLFRSDDGGVHWAAVPGQPVGLRPNHLVCASDGICYLSYGREPGPEAMSAGAVWKFDPGKNFWTEITPLKSNEDGQPFGYGAVAVDARHPATILATTFCHWKPHDEIFRSTNSGATWVPLLQNARLDYSFAPYTKRLKPHWMGGLLINPFDSDQVWFGTGYGVWCGTNVTAADGGRPTDWIFSDAGLEETVPLALASPPEGAHLLSGVGDVDGFRHDDLDAPPAQGSFAGPHFNNTEGLAFAAGRPQIVVRVGTGGSNSVHAALSSDGGKSWRLLESDPSPGEAGGVVAISCDGKAIVWTTRHSVPHVTTDHGANWLECAGLASGIRVVADPVNPRRFYAFDPRAGKLFASTNGAAGFAPTAAGLSPPSDQRSGFGFDIPSGAELSAAPGLQGDLWLDLGRRGLWHSADGGESFIRLENIGTATAFGFGRAAPDAGFPALFLFGVIGSHQGIFRSDDNGRSWLCLNDAEHQFGWITKLTGDPRVFGRVYLATAGRGIVRGDPAVN